MGAVMFSRLFGWSGNSKEKETKACKKTIDIFNKIISDRADLEASEGQMAQLLSIFYTILEYSKAQQNSDGDIDFQEQINDKAKELGRLLIFYDNTIDRFMPQNKKFISILKKRQSDFDVTKYAQYKMANLLAFGYARKNYGNIPDTLSQEVALYAQPTHDSPQPR